MSAAWSRQRNGYVGLDGGDPDNLGQTSAAARGRRHGQRLAAWRERAAGEAPCWPNGRWPPDWQWADGMTARKAQLMTLGYTYELSKRTTVMHSPAMRRTTRWTTSSTPAIPTTRYAMGVTHRF